MEAGVKDCAEGTYTCLVIFPWPCNWEQNNPKANSAGTTFLPLCQLHGNNLEIAAIPTVGPVTP